MNCLDLCWITWHSSRQEHMSEEWEWTPAEFAFSLVESQSHFIKLTENRFQCSVVLFSHSLCLGLLTAIWNTSLCWIRSKSQLCKSSEAFLHCNCGDIPAIWSYRLFVIHETKIKFGEYSGITESMDEVITIGFGWCSWCIAFWPLSCRHTVVFCHISLEWLLKVKPRE